MSQRDGDAQGNWYEPERSGKHIVTQILLVGLAVFCWCGMGVAGEPVPHGGKSAGSFMNYVLPTNGFDTEMVIVNNDVRNSSPNHAMLYRAYDGNGNVLAEVPDFMATGSRIRNNSGDTILNFFPFLFSYISIYGEVINNRHRLFCMSQFPASFVSI